MQIKQAQSSLREAWEAGQLNNQALEEAQRSKKLNNYIMLFTVITVIFVSTYTRPGRLASIGIDGEALQTPMSFMTSLFAVSVNEFPHNDSGNLAYGSMWIAGRMGEVQISLDRIWLH